jgi:hypothetical protein
MSILRSASENGQSGAVGSSRGATGAATDSKYGVVSSAWRCRFLVGSSVGYVFAASARTRHSSIWSLASRALGRDSLASHGAVVESALSTANKSLKFVPALRASTGRS